jgi:hypothetical protein
VSNIAASTTDLSVFQEALTSPWINASWSATPTFGSTDQHYAGSTSIKVAQSANGGFSLHYGSWGATVPVTPASYTGIEFALYGGTSGATISVLFQNDLGNTFPSVSCGTIPANTWKVINVPMSQLDPNNYPIYRLSLMEKSGSAKTYYVDNMRFIGAAAPAPKMVATRTAGGSDPKAYALEQNYPNPFNPATIIHFALPEQSLVSLKVYNMLGQEVSTLLNNEQMDTGNREVSFNGGNLASGVYVYRLEAQGLSGNNFVSVKRMVLAK